MNVEQFYTEWNSEKKFALCQFFKKYFVDFSLPVLVTPIRLSDDSTYTCSFLMKGVQYQDNENQIYNCGYKFPPRRIANDNVYSMTLISSLIPNILRSGCEFTIIQGSNTIGCGKIVP